MKLLCTKTKLGIDLNDVQIVIDDRTYTIGGLARQEEHNGLLHQWWILMEDKN